MGRVACENWGNFDCSAELGSLKPRQKTPLVSKRSAGSAECDAVGGLKGPRMNHFPLCEDNLEVKHVASTP